MALTASLHEGALQSAMSAQDLRACEGLMRHGSKSFFAAGRLLPGRIRMPATALYAFCRVADDAIDEASDPAQATVRLARRLDAIYDGRPHDDEVDRAFAAVVRCYQIPRKLPEALLEGFLWDTEGRRYETLSEVLDYAARVAASVGVMMTLIMGVRRPAALARACELGLAMQLTNIARDVGEDARMGRLYLPRTLLREAGIDPDAWLADPQFTTALAAVIERLLGTADALYEQAREGLAELPRDCRAAIATASSVYREIGWELRRRGLDSVNRRAVVCGQRKFALILQSMVAVMHVGEPRRAPSGPHESVAYLVEAAARSGADELPAFTFYQRTVRIIELLERSQRSRLMPGRDFSGPMAGF
jgi:phytoene synthase